MFNVILLGIVSLLTDVSTEMVYPLLPLYLTSARIGATPAIVGLIEGFAESIASLVRVFSGYFSDKLQQRKPLAIAGYSFSTFGKVFLALAGTWQIVFVGRLADRFGKGIRTAPRDALIADSTPADKRGNAFGLHRALDSAGASLGVMIAFVLFVSLKDDYSSIFLVSIIPAAIAVFFLFLVRETISPSAQKKPVREAWWRNLGQRWKLLDRKLKFFLIIVFIFALGNSSNEFLLLRASGLGVDPATVILMYLLYNIVYAALSWPLGRLSDRIGRKSLLVIGYFTYGIVYIGFALTGSLALWGLFAMYGVYVAMTEGVEKALVSELAPTDLRATLIGLHDAAIGFGLLPASLLAGFLMTFVGQSAPFYFGGAMGALASMALLFLI